jgi:hypothetical protein
MYVCMYVCMYVRMYVLMYVCTRMYGCAARKCLNGLANFTHIPYLSVYSLYGIENKHILAPILRGPEMGRKGQNAIFLKTAPRILIKFGQFMENSSLK